MPAAFPACVDRLVADHLDIADYFGGQLLILAYQPVNTERSVHCVQRRPSVLGLHRFFDYYAYLFCLLNSASSTTHLTYRTKYIQFFIYSIQEFLAIRVKCRDIIADAVTPYSEDVDFEARSLQSRRAAL